jgi:hypothetical protein
VAEQYRKYGTYPYPFRLSTHDYIHTQSEVVVIVRNWIFTSVTLFGEDTSAVTCLLRERERGEGVLFNSSVVKYQFLTMASHHSHYKHFVGLFPSSAQLENHIHYVSKETSSVPKISD